MNLATRLTLGTFPLALFTALAVGYSALHNVEQATLPATLAQIEQLAEQSAEDLGQYIEQAKADVTALSQAPAVTALFGRVAPAEAASWRRRLAVLFSAQMAAKPNYLQLRLIGADEGGREIVRIDRKAAGAPVRNVQEAELQQKGARSYFTQASRHPAGSTYVSRIDLNVEHGQVETPHTPVVRVAAPVRSKDGRVRGIVVINLDVRPMFTRIKAIPMPGAQAYVVDGQGNYLLHPDPARRFGFQLGKAYRWQSDFPELARAGLGAGGAARFTQTASGGEVAVAVASTFLAAGNRITVIHAVPGDSVRSALTGVINSTLVAGLIACVLAVFLAYLVSRSLTRPLAQITHAVETFEEVGDAPLPTQAGGEIGVLARAFERHSEGEQLLSAVFAHSSHAIMTTDIDGTITSWNPASKRLYGYTAAEAVGRDVRMLVPDDAREQFDALVRRRNLGEIIEPQEVERLTKDGRRVTLSLAASPILSPAGGVVGASVIALDVTGQKLAEDRFRIAFDASPAGMLLADSFGRIALANAECERMFGYTSEELIGLSVDKLVPKSARGGHARNRAAYFKAPSSRRMGVGRDLAGVRKDGTEFPVEIALNTMRLEHETVAHAVVVDISDRKQAEETVQLQAEELLRSNAELEQFAYVASHDMREPLRMVASYTELLAQRYKGQLDERADKYINYAVDGAKRMQQLIDDLLVYSRVGSQGRDFASTDVGKVLDSVRRSLERVIEETGAKIEVANMPTVIGDEGQLRQLFQNLIENAIKFRGEEPPLIRIGANQNGRIWTFTVSDNGIGIEAQHAERIFQMFQRLHAKGTYAGSGIGLALAKRIVQRHGGRIWFDVNASDRQAGGTTFSFTLAANANRDRQGAMLANVG